MSFNSALNLPRRGVAWATPEPIENLPGALVPRFMRPLRIMLDPGHGGAEKGAHGILGTMEKELALTLGKRIQLELKKQASLKKIPLQVRLTRDKDQAVPLRTRVSMANDWHADLFLSIHGNAAPSEFARGFEVYFLSEEASDDHTHYLVRQENQADGPQLRPGVQSILSDLYRANHIEESAHFAQTLFQTMRGKIRPNRRGVRQGPFTVLFGTQMPAALLEVGYLSNRQDARNLRSEGYLNQLVDAISSGILEYAQHLRRLG